MDKIILKNVRKYVPVALILTLSLLYACMPPPPVCVKNNQTYCKVDGNFTHEWYDYYERGLSCMEGRCYDDAMTAMEKAIDMRPDDKRMARTYGIGHLNDYFPHREKGVIHYFQNDYAAAKSELEISLRHEPSVKARVFLDKVRRAMMIQRGEKAASPRISVTKPDISGEIWTNADPVWISGVAESSQYVSEIMVRDRAIPMEGSGERVVFEEKFKLSQGRQEIEIIARNLLEGTAGQKVVIHVDRAGPVITLEKSAPGIVGLKGYLYDESGEISLFADGVRQNIFQGGEAEFFIPIINRGETIRLMAQDKLGNQTMAIVNPEMLSRHFPPMALMAQTSSDIATDIQIQQASMTGDSPEPRIILKNFPDQESVFSEMFLIEGEARGKNEIKAVFVNNMPIHIRAGQAIFFSHPLRLKIGENRILIQAKDESAGLFSEERVIVRDIPEPFRHQYRCMFKAAPFTHNMDEDTNFALFEYNFLGSLIARKRFQVSMQEKLEKTLRELKFDLGRIKNPRPDQEKIRPPRFMLSGYIYKSREGIEILSKIVEIATGKILDVLDTYVESGTQDVLTFLGQKLSEKFHRTFPLVKGRIVRKKGKVSCAETEGRMRLLSWPLVVGSDTEFVGDARIEEIGKHEVCIELINHGEKNSDMGDWVITQ